MGKSGAKIEITRFFMSVHYGICTGFDSISRIVIKEKEAWSGAVSAQTAIAIDKTDLFGGDKKEGGAKGTCWFLPGNDTQLLPDELAQRLGRSGGADCPGYRGMASAFFIGSSSNGFYWTANVPYLPGTWIKGTRAPKGLNAAYALIPDGSESGPIAYSPVTTISIDPDANGANNGILGLTRGITVGGFSPTDIVKITLPEGQDFGGWSPWGQPAHTGLHTGALNHIRIIPDGQSTFAFSRGVAPEGSSGGADFGFDGYEAARAAFGEQTFTGASSYTFFVQDYPYADNTGGMDIFIEKGSPETGGNANPAHMIYECLTNTDWGMGSPDTAIDVASFEECGVTLYDEGLGLSMIWTRQASIQKFIQEVLDHIQAVLFVDPATGLLTLKLIRDDYDVSELPDINPSNAELSNFGRKLWGEIPNEIVVTWTNPETEQEETITVQDLGSIVTQGGIVSDARNFYGVRSATVAQQLGARELRAAGAPLAACEAEVDRTLWRIRPASVLTVTWPEHGLSGVVMRVVDVNYGRPGEPTIKVSLMEDVYGLDAGDYVAPPETHWSDPSAEPAPVEQADIFTLPLFFALQTATGSTGASATYPEVLAGVLANTSDEDTYLVELWDEVAQPDGSLEWTRLADLTVVARGLLADDIPAAATSIIDVPTGLAGSTDPTQGGFAIIGAGGEEDVEIALVTAVAATITLNRGVLDTVPRAWPIGTPVWFVDDEAVFNDPLVRSSGEEVTYKLRTRTSQGLLDLSAATAASETLTDRPWMPLRPANVLAFGEAFSDESSPIDATMRADPWVTVDWANRNRLLEDTQVLAWTDATVTPETGQTTEIEVLTGDGLSTLATHPGLTGTSFDVPDASFGAEEVVILRVKSSRTDADGTFESLQSFDHYVRVLPPTIIATESGEMSPFSCSSSAIVHGGAAMNSTLNGFSCQATATVTAPPAIFSISGGTGATAGNASVTPVNPTHVAGDTLLCVVAIRDNTANMACSTAGWVAATGITNPQFFNSGKLYLFMNECDSASESNPTITISSGSPNVVCAVVLRIRGRSFGASFNMGTRAFNASAANSIPFPNDSPVIEPNNGILAIGVKNFFGGTSNVISGVNAGLSWSEFAEVNTATNSDLCLSVQGAINTSGSDYTAGTGGTISGYTSTDTSGSVYVEVNAA